MTRTPHFLRVVQALAFVSGIAPIAVVETGCFGRVQEERAVADDAGPDTAGWPMGAVVGPEYDGQAMGTAPDPYDGQVTGVEDVVSIPYPYDGQVTGVTPYDGGVLGIGPPPDDGGTPDAPLLGGPLSPPELPSFAPEAMV